MKLPKGVKTAGGGSWKQRRSVRQMNRAWLGNYLSIASSASMENEERPAHTTGVHSQKCARKDFIKKINSVKSQ